MKRHDGSNSGSMKCNATNRMKNTAVAPNETLDAVSENAVSGFVVMLIFGILSLSSSPPLPTPLVIKLSVMTQKPHSAKPSNAILVLWHAGEGGRPSTSI